MKKFLLLATLITALLLTGCGKTYEDGYAEGYDDGYIEGFSDRELDWFDYADDMYYEGYSEGYHDGMEECTSMAAYYVEEAQQGSYGEDGLIILEGYFMGEYSREEAMEALEWISNYYWQTEEALTNLSNGNANIG